MRLMFTRALQRPARSSFALIALACLWMVSVGNIPLWQTLHSLPEIQGWKGFGLSLVFAGVIACITAALLALLNWRWTLKPAIGLMLLLCAFATHYILLYGVVLNTSMVVNIMQTDWHEARDQLSWRLLVTVLLLALAPIYWLWRQPVRSMPWSQQLIRNLLVFGTGLLLAFAALQLVFQDFASLMRNHRHLRFQANPLNSVYSLLNYQLTVNESADLPPTPIGTDAHIVPPTPTRPPLLVYVLGETARSQNFSLNGYPRLTNPRLAKENVTSFTQVISCGTSTAESVPCMFSHLGRKAFNQKTEEFENLLDVLQRAGYGVLWIENQSGCKDQCKRIPTVNTAQLQRSDHCVAGECRDRVMLHEVQTALSQVSPERRARGLVIVMHQMGSHGPAYYKRTDPSFKTFVPECTETSLSGCDRQSVVNAYDNTIVQTDDFLAQVIGWLKTQDKTHTTAMLYVSDHGESLGEKNLFLHGLPYSIAPAEQTTVPLITWLSPSFEKFRGVKTSCLQARRSHALSHDHLYHSVLGLMAVQTASYQRELDLFAACEGR